LAGGELIVCNYKFKPNTKQLMLSYQNTLGPSGITKYILFYGGISPVLCVSVPGHIYFYKKQGANLLQVLSPPLFSSSPLPLLFPLPFTTQGSYFLWVFILFFPMVHVFISHLSILDSLISPLPSSFSISLPFILSSY
jgi:hypothetical protein